MSEEPWVVPESLCDCRSGENSCATDVISPAASVFVSDSRLHEIYFDCFIENTGFDTLLKLYIKKVQLSRGQKIIVVCER